MKSTTPHSNPSLTSRIFLAFVLILSGVLMLTGHIIDPVWYKAIISWPMLLIVVSIYLFIRRSLIAGIATGLIGLFFWLPLTGLIDKYPVQSIWPVALVGAGLVILLSPHCSRRRNRMSRINSTTSNSTTDGFFYADNSFGEIRQTVTDEIFKGADIKNSFGSVILDLRRCEIAEGETFVNIECSFGGIEIYAPSDWNIRVELRPFMGGYEDSRLKNSPVDPTRVLIIRGNISFSGLEIKG